MEKNKKKSPLKAIGNWILTTDESSILIALIILSVIVGLVNEVFVSSANIINVLRSTGFTLITVVGMSFVIISGGLDLSVGAVYCLAGTVASEAAFHGWPTVFAVLIGLIVGAACGAFNGLVIVYMGIPALIVTLGMMYIARGIVYVVTQGVPVYPLPDSFKAIELTKLFGVVPIVIIIALAFAVIAHIVLKKTPYGRAIYAVGGNSEAARVSGINTSAIRMSVYVLVSTLAGLSGIFMMARLGSAQASSGTGFEMTTIAATIIGGTSTYGGVGSIIGSVLGALFMEVLTNSLTLLRISVYWQDIVVGVVLIGAVVLDNYKRKLMQRSAVSNLKGE